MLLAAPSRRFPPQQLSVSTGCLQRGWIRTAATPLDYL
jgi:hypothetical protein